jgi:hypothetical protein
MSRSWNGESLVNELSALLGDTSTAFKSRVLGWLNDTVYDISTRHDWGFHLVKGKKKLTEDEEEHSLEIAAPDAPTVALAAGGTLTTESDYVVLVTFVQANGVETKAGDVSATISTDAGTNLTIEVTAIPIAEESLVTQRKVYLSKDAGPFYLHTTLDDNFETSLTIDADVSSTVEPPDYESIRKLKGSPFFEESPSRQLIYRDLDQLRLLIQGQWSSGSPEYFAPKGHNSLVTYPMPTAGLELSFYYYRNPFRLYNADDSQPDLPIFLKPVLKAGVIALGYEYRDRAGQEIKKANYENAIVDAINRGARVANVEYSVRDVYGSFTGFEVG